jgi:iron-sulfur cluster assembly protein
MLTLTKDAAEAVTRIVAADEDISDSGGLRIFREPAGRTQTRLAVTVAEVPNEDDQVIEQEGARVFVDSAVSALLEDKTLDADTAENGVHFTLKDS